MKTIEEVKKTIKQVILESYAKSKSKKFTELNYVFIDGKSPISHLKGKLKIFDNLDEYSQTFLSIHTKAKLTLREFQSDFFEGDYLELLRLILTLPESLNSNKLKSVSVKNIDGNDIVYKETKIAEVKDIKNIEIKKGTVLIKEKVTGKKIIKEKKKHEDSIDELSDLEFDEDEFDEDEFDEEFEEDDIKDLKL